MTLTPATNRIGALVRSLLDQGYEQATTAVLTAISASVTAGIVAQRLAELDAEAARLQAAGQRLQPDNPVLRALIADLEPELHQDRSRIGDGAALAASAGVAAAGTLTRELALPGLADVHLAAVGVAWNTPDPQAINALVGYVRSDAWAQMLAQYPGTVLDTVMNQAVRGMVEGWGAARTASAIRQMAQGVPVAQANTLMRTVQLESYRSATAIHQMANADIIEKVYWVATLDDATCLSCIAMNGTELQVGERVDGHYNCRCCAVASVIGRNLNVPSGEDWFNGLDEAQQRNIAGDSAYELLASGQATLQDFVHAHTDPVFGRMVSTASVKSVLARGNR